MKEIMMDLETLDVKSSAVVLSIGAVVFEMTSRTNHMKRKTTLDYKVLDRFYRVLDMTEQMQNGRTVSESTLLWWMNQDADARAEAFAPAISRRDVWGVMEALQGFVDGHNITTIEYPSAGVKIESVERINKFWASPVSFDFGIWNDLADGIDHGTPWKYNQVYDVRTVLNEASYSAKDHKLSKLILGKAHMPVYDCEVQIDELVAARNKIGRRINIS